MTQSLYGIPIRFVLGYLLLSLCCGGSLRAAGSVLDVSCAAACSNLADQCQEKGAEPFCEEQCEKYLDVPANDPAFESFDADACLSCCVNANFTSAFCDRAAKPRLFTDCVFSDRCEGVCAVHEIEGRND